MIGLGMLRINQSSSAAAKTYYNSAAEYYGAGEQEMIGDWGGKAAERLGLYGKVLERCFHRLCENRHPFTDEQLTARMRAGRRVGYDFNFHSCKSASILYAITDDPAILEAFRQAVAEVMAKMEAGIKVRVRKRGQMAERTVGNFIFAEYLHFTARPVNGIIDPHLHAHCFVPNCCWDHVEQMWKAIDVASVKEDAPHWQAMFQKSFGQRLAGLGYAVAWKGDNFEIEGIERATIERFSRRSGLVNRVAAERGITDAHAKDQLGAATRERKRKDATMPQLRGEWRQRLTDAERNAIAQAALRQRRPLPAERHHVQDTTGYGINDTFRQRQRIASHERTRATHKPQPAPTPPRQSRSKGYGR